LDEWIDKTRFNYLLSARHLTRKDIHKLKGLKIMFQANGIQKQAEVAIIMPKKAQFKPKIRNNIKSHYILIKGTIHQEDIATVNVCALNIDVLSFTKQIDWA
jgi:hypothetical protein